MRIDSKFIESAQHRTANRLQQEAMTNGLEATCAAVLDSLTNAVTRSDPESLFDRFLNIVWLFANCPPAYILRRQVDTLTTMAEYLLNILGIKPHASKVSSVYRLLYQARSKTLADRQEPWLAAWSLTLADAMSGEDSDAAVAADASQLLNLAELQFRSGFVMDSLVTLQRAEEFVTSSDAIVALRLGSARCLRVLNDIDAAATTLAGIKGHFQTSPLLAAKLAWEAALLEAQRLGDVAPLLHRIRYELGHPGEAEPEYFLLANLWCYASAQKAAIAQLPGSSRIKRVLMVAGDDLRSAQLLSLLKILEDCYATKLGILDKLKELGDALAELRQRQPTEGAAIFFAAISRWLLRAKHGKSAAFVINDYHAASHVLSQGRTSTLFGLLVDLGERLLVTAETGRSQVKSVALKAGMDRTLLYAELSAKFFLALIIARTKRWRDPESWEVTKQELIVKLSRYLMMYAGGAMKGPIHKFAQLLLNYLPLSPEAEANFRAVLWSRHVLPAKIMRKILEEDLGAPCEAVFDDFDFEPIGVGSVSQVYRARLKTGEEVAVKIQYPGLEDVVRQDMAMATRIFYAARWLFPSVDAGALKDLMRRICENELDFRHEVQTVARLQALVEEGTRWHLPTVYRHLSTRRVLVTEYIAGVNFYTFLETASDEEKTRAGMAFHEFINQATAEAGLILLDPHPANMILCGDRLYIIDFGFFVPAPEAYRNLFRDLLLCHLAPEPEIDGCLLAVMRAAGIITSHPEISEEAVLAFVKTLSAMYDWRNGSDPNLHKKFNEDFFAHGLNRIFGARDPNFFLGHLATHQAAITMSRFGVDKPANWHRTVASEVAKRRSRLPLVG